MSLDRRDYGEWFFTAACLIAGHGAVTVATTEGSPQAPWRSSHADHRHGTGRSAARETAAGQAQIGLRPVGFLAASERGAEGDSAIPVLGEISSPEQAVLEHRVEHAIISFSRSPPEVELDSLQRLEQLGVSVFDRPSAVRRAAGSRGARAGRGPAAGQYLSVDRAGLADPGQVRVRSRRCPRHHPAPLTPADRRCDGRAGLHRSAPCSSASAESGSTAANSTCSSSGRCAVYPMTPLRSRLDGRRSPRASLPAAWRVPTGGRVSARSYGEPRSTSCLSSSTCCAARCRSSARAPSVRRTSGHSRSGFTAMTSATG